MSYLKQIADAVVSVVAALDGAPATVVFRNTDVTHPDESYPLAIVTAGNSETVEYTTGNCVFRTYEIAVSLYLTNLSTNQTNLDTNPNFVQLCQKALSNHTALGISSVYGTQIVRNDAWERQPFRDGVEKSVFGIIVMNSEEKV